jgi:hypothetical protein
MYRNAHLWLHLTVSSKSPEPLGIIDDRPLDRDRFAVHMLGMTIEQAIEEAQRLFPSFLAVDESAGGRYRIVLEALAHEKRPGQTMAMLSVEEDDRLTGDGDTPEAALEDLKRKRNV